MRKIIPLPKSPKNSELQNSYFILQYSINTSSSFLDIFNETRTRRHARGTPTDEEQDLLRAMLLFSSSGLDSMVKQMITDCLSKIIANYDGALAVFQSFVERKLRKEETMNHKYFAEIIITEDPKQFLIKELIYHLKSDSIQSSDQLLKVFSFFDIPSSDITKDIQMLRSIFNVRNQIAHEMDIDFNQPNRNRIPRRKDKMIEYSKFLLSLSSHILMLIDKKLSGI